MYKGKATCLNINENDKNWIERTLCLGDMGCQIKFKKTHQALSKKAYNYSIFQQDLH